MSESLLNRAAISLGSNIRPLENLPAAVRELARWGTIERTSQVWESAPAGFLDQPNFLNAAVLLATDLGPEELKQNVLHPIEQKLHRVRDPENVNAPRTIDLDLSALLTPTSSQVFEPDIFTRVFVAVPLAELLPDFVPPGAGCTLAEIAQSLAGTRELIPRPDCPLAEECVSRKSVDLGGTL